MAKQILSCYNKIIRSGTFQNLEAVIEKVSIYFDQQNINETFEVTLIECIFLSIRYPDQMNEDLNLKCLEFLANNLENENGQVRALSFAGISLASSIHSYEIPFFTEWCKVKLDELSKLAAVDFNDYKQRVDLLYVIASLRHIDLDVFKSVENSELWPRELLTSNLFRQLEPCADSEKINFYEIWLQIEENQSFNSNVLLLHINLNISTFKSLKEINELLCVLNKNKSNLKLNELNIDDLTALLQQRIKQDWCVGLIEGLLQNKETFSRTYLGQLATNICQKFEVRFIQTLFDSLSLIDDLKAFESLLEFCSVNLMNKMSGDFLIKNVRCQSVNSFHNLLKVKHLCDNFDSSLISQEQTGILFGLLLELLNKNHWEFEQLNEMLLTIKKNQKKAAQFTIDILRMISFYDLSSMKYKECLNILKEEDPLKHLNKIVVENKFHQKDIIKNHVQLLEELDRDNSISNIKISKLKETIK